MDKSIENIIMTTKTRQSKYDATLKQLIAKRPFLARVLKRFAKEYQDLPVGDIEQFVDPQSITCSKIGVSKNMTNHVEGMNTEDKSNNEGNVNYDILFRSIYPGDRNKSIGMYINLEIQGDYYPGYPIEMRAVYYSARVLSAELPIITQDTNYGELQKVYSIWICMGDNIPDSKAGTATLYHLAKDDIIGTVDVDERVYDLLSVVILRFRDDTEMEDETMRLLQTLCSNSLNAKEKLGTLEEMGFEITPGLESEVLKVCNLGEAIAQENYKKGEAIGRTQGEAIGRTQGEAIGRFQSIDALLENDVPIEQAMNMLKVTKTEQLAYQEWKKSGVLQTC